MTRLFTARTGSLRTTDTLNKIPQELPLGHRQKIAERIVLFEETQLFEVRHELYDEALSSAPDFL